MKKGDVLVTLDHADYQQRVNAAEAALAGRPGPGSGRPRPAWARPRPTCAPPKPPSA
ncbi:MAG: biotin/lipoyl-binding protein [Hymenobacter sp.]